MVERCLCKADVSGSNPLISTNRLIICYKAVDFKSESSIFFAFFIAFIIENRLEEGQMN